MSALSCPPPSPTCALFAQYSPLFTSGLLSDPRVPTKRRKCAHDSFPLTVNTASLSFSGVLRSSLDLVEDSTLFLTLAPRRRVPEGRSFLSLDLAESQSMRSVSLRRKDTVTTRATAATLFGRSEPSSPSALSPLSHRAPLSLSFSRPAPSPRRALPLPSPKPAPRASLPQPPRRPALSLSTAPSSQLPSPVTHRPTRSAPSLLPPPARTSPLASPALQCFMVCPTRPASPGSARSVAAGAATLPSGRDGTGEDAEPACAGSPESCAVSPARSALSVSTAPAPSVPRVVAGVSQARSAECSYLLFSPTSPARAPPSVRSVSTAAPIPTCAPAPSARAGTREEDAEPAHARSSPEYSYLLFSPTDSSSSSVGSPPPAHPTALTASPSVRSTSTAARQMNRSAALAALEGRSRSTSRRRRRRSNFMSMSDDEEEEEEEEVALERVLGEEEDVVVPVPVVGGGGAGCRTIGSVLYPLANFIDLREDEFSGRSWRSFVEVSS
ncbi:hypothetical protein SCP_0900050 [Sparassis crispa]|uniref:Uncharacterized protein n=1 Tax=Sparassis crispa TaxID=139825 RepID=A0A401GV78_9APHY|nr:hypothetical protein SCP_0900050 [Sparassis crispa]GBE86128.1 hypothetical protein SCP_0900050 [Sparassis crispa]